MVRKLGFSSWSFTASLDAGPWNPSQRRRPGVSEGPQEIGDQVDRAGRERDAIGAGQSPRALERGAGIRDELRVSGFALTSEPCDERFQGSWWQGPWIVTAGEPTRSAF